jgi:hypothetical protein
MRPSLCIVPVDLSPQKPDPFATAPPGEAKEPDERRNIRGQLDNQSREVSRLEKPAALVALCQLLEHRLSRQDVLLDRDTESRREDAERTPIS